MRITRRAAQLKSEGAYSVLAKARALEAAGREVIHLEIGQPDIETYANIRQAGIEAIEAGRTRYNPPAGIPELRAAIAADAGARRGMTFSAEQVVVSPGAKLNLLLPLLALVEPGEEVIYPDPGFPSYPAAIAIAGAVPIPLPLDAQRGFALDLQAFEDALSAHTRAVILNSPGNPTGGVLQREDLEHIAARAAEHDLWIISDEIYSRLHYLDHPVPSIASLPGMAERTVIVDGFSKTFAMTGWRLGYGVMPGKLAARVALLVTHSIGCTAHFTQYAGLEALAGPQEQVEETLAEYRRRRDTLVEGLNALPGVRCELPMGAFYTFPDIRATGLSSAALAERLLEEAGVALLPGTAFGAHGEGHLRLTYANNRDNLMLALQRMRPVFEALAA